MVGLAGKVPIEFNKSIIKFPSIERVPGGAPSDLLPNLQNPENPVPLRDPNDRRRSAVTEAGPI